jgi:hypothetical protein
LDRHESKTPALTGTSEQKWLKVPANNGVCVLFLNHYASDAPSSGGRAGISLPLRAVNVTFRELRQIAQRIFWNLRIVRSSRFTGKTKIGPRLVFL